MSAVGLGKRHRLTQEERLRGARLGGLAVSKKKAPTDCEHCQMMGYDSHMQPLGHLGFDAVMKHNPSALHSLREKIRKTGRKR